MWLPNGADPRLKEYPEGAVLPRQFNVYSVNDNHKNNNARAKVVGKYCDLFTFLNTDSDPKVDTVTIGDLDPDWNPSLYMQWEHCVFSIM